jgi:hypothetical protein
VVTGATAGIGRTFVDQLVDAGCEVLLVARDGNRLAAVAGEIVQRGGRAAVMVADLSTEAGIDAVCDAMQRLAVDVLVHNAGFGTRGLLHTTDGSRQSAMVRLHVVALDRLVRAVLPGQRARGRGTIIVVSSVASYTTSGANVNYTATKAYQRVFMESLALELYGSGVVVQALCPGFTRTEFHDRARMNMSRIPAWLWMRPDEVVRCSLAAAERGDPVVVVPGWRWRAIVWLLRHLPRALVRRSARRYQATRG